MNRVFDILKKYMIFIAILTGISIVLGMSYSNFIVASENHKVAEMYIGTLKYSMTIDGSTTNTLSVPAGETIVDVTITNENPIDTYYKLIYQNNSNVTIKYYQAYDLDNSNNISKTYNKANDKIISNNTNTIKLKITNNSSSSQSINFKTVGGFATNTLDDVLAPTGYTIINVYGTQNVDTYFCTTTDSLTEGLQYVNGQYTYAYKQEGKYASSGLAWNNITNNGWGVQLTDKTSTDTISSKVCTYINKKPIVSMSLMFSNSQATALNLNSFNTENVTNMSNMFSNSQATTLDLSNFNTSNVTSMNGMFWSSQATTLNINSFNTENVTNMSNMFTDSQATTLNLSSFNTSNVTDMNSMFANSQATTLDLSGFNTENVTDMSSMFSESQATTFALSGFNTSKVTNMRSMFSYSQATTLDLSNFNTSNVTNMTQMFYGSNVTSLNLSSFDTSKVTDMGQMFFAVQTPILDLSNFDTSNVVSMYGMFWKSAVKTIYVSDKFIPVLSSAGRRMFSNCKNLVGGAGTAYSNYEEDGSDFAHIDGGTSNPGYFTDVTDKPKDPISFANDSWKTIANAVKNNNISKYNVGDTKTIDMGTYGTHTLRIANTSTPSECSTSSFSQTACGFVLEFADIITTHNMNPSGTYNGTNYSNGWNKDGWPATAMRTFVNNDIYNALPSDLKNAIIDTTVVSGHGPNDTTNFTSTDKLYLLAPGEVWSDWKTSDVSSYDTAKDLTRTLDYYINMGVTTENRSPAIKNNDGSAELWYLRTAYSSRNIAFFIVWNDGRCSTSYASNVLSVSPAFRIG